MTVTNAADVAAIMRRNRSDVPGTFPEPSDQHVNTVTPPEPQAEPSPPERSGNPDTERSDPPEPDDTGALYFDVAAMLDGTMPPPPTPDVCERDDGIGLFYRGQFNVVFGDPECGKTLLCDHATAEELRNGGRALRLDLDHNGPAATVNRLIALGAPVDTLRDPQRFLYVEPEDRLHLQEIAAHMVTWAPTLVVLDSIGELIPMYGANSNQADDFTTVHTRMVKPLTRTGACVVGIDHLSKGTESRSYGQTGSAAKKRAIGGASLRVKIDAPFTPGKGGNAFLSINKDRHGGLREHSPSGDREALAGKFTLQADGERLHARIRAPMDGERNPAEAPPAADLAALDALDPPPSTLDDTQARLNWNRQRTSKALKAWRKRQADR